MAPALTLPRSVQLALRLTSGADAEALVADPDALAAGKGTDEPHLVATYDDDAPVAQSTLGTLLGAWGGTVRSAAAVLPAPGDVCGVPATVSDDAVAAGECVLATTPAGSFAAVPLGSARDSGHLVTWQVRRVPPWEQSVLGAVGSVADAERTLREALVTAVAALDSLDVARWRPDAVDAIGALREHVDGVHPDPMRARVLALSARLRVIVALATADDGGAVNLWQSDQRSAALRHIDTAARHAMCAATLVAGVPQSTER